MISPRTTLENKKREFEHLCVEDFVHDIFSARALATAFQIRLIDFLQEHKKATPDLLIGHLGMDSRGAVLLIGLLRKSRVLEDHDGELELSREFTHALRFRDLLEVKLAVANFAVHDFLDYFTDQVCRPGEFMRKGRFCGLFSYGRCFEGTRENYESTRQWMRITTALTKYEAQACLKYHDFSGYRRILDIGGNSGEFALRICRAHPHLHAVVFDLPLVCDIGMEHLRSEPEADRISFVKGNALTDPLPEGLDLIVFKSMLHDWPEKEAGQLIAKASRSLRPGGTLLIFERGPMDTNDRALSYGDIPMLLFFHSFRSPAVYEKRFIELGLKDIAVKELFLDTTFFILTAKKGI